MTCRTKNWFGMIDIHTASSNGYIVLNFINVNVNCCFPETLEGL